ARLAINHKVKRPGRRPSIGTYHRKSRCSGLSVFGHRGRGAWELAIEARKPSGRWSPVAGIVVPAHWVHGTESVLIFFAEFEIHRPGKIACVGYLARGFHTQKQQALSRCSENGKGVDFACTEPHR